MRPETSKKTNVTLWTIQVVLALLFLFAGGMKLVLPLAALKGPIPLPGLFLRFIGVCEVSGALGLILPGLLKIQRRLTPLAASGLVIIMSGATIITIAGGSAAGASIPFVVGILAITIARGRRSWGAVRVERGRRMATRRSAWSPAAAAER